MNTANDSSPGTPLHNRLSIKNIQKTRKSPRTPIDSKTLEILDDFRGQYNQKALSDVTVVLSDGKNQMELHCHVLVLSQNHVLEALISKQKSRTANHTIVQIELDENKFTPFTHMLKHLYQMKVLPATLREVVLVLELAREYKIETLEREYSMMLSMTAPEDIETFLMSDFLSSLQVEQVAAIMGSDHLPVENEQVVYDAACKYLRNHPEVDPSLLKRVVKFPLLVDSTSLEESPFTFTEQQTNELNKVVSPSYQNSTQKDPPQEDCIQLLCGLKQKTKKLK